MSSWPSVQSRCLVPAALALLISGTAGAMIPPSAQSDFTIPLPQYDDFTYRSATTDADRAEVTASLTGRVGGAWRVWSWNPRARTPHALYGSGFRLSAPFGTKDQIVAASRRLIQDFPEVFRAEDSNLRVTASPAGYGKQSVHFQQTYHGLDVWGATVHLVFTDGGRLFALGSDYHRGITVNPNPSVPATVAQEIAQRNLASVHGTLDPEAPRLLVLPVPRSQADVDYSLVWLVRVRTEEPLGRWATYVDAHSGGIVWRYNEISFIDLTGTTSSPVQRPTNCEPPQEEPMPFVQVTANGVGTATADAAGAWTIPYSGTDERTVTASFEGPYVRVANQAGPSGTFTATAVPGAPLTVAFTDANSQQDERTVYRTVNDVHLFFQDIDPSYPFIHEQMPARVSIAATCNAYYDLTLNFYMAGDGCANTGEIMQVVQHEYCHGITWDLLDFMGYEGLGEGNSDVLANLMSGESIIGRGFHLDCADGIRNSENTLQYPQDLNGEFHHDGQIIAGFHWDSWQELAATLPAAEALHVAANTWHWGRAHFRPLTHMDQIFATFLADDDDGDLTNGTPHYEALRTGAVNHGYGYPPRLEGVIWVHGGVASRTEAGDAVITARAYSTQGNILPDSVSLHYRLGAGSWVTSPMTPSGDPQFYTATIAGLQSGDEVEYYLRGRDDQGNTGTSPVEAPATVWPFDVATVVDDFEEESGWMRNVEGADTATDGNWVMDDPNGTILNCQQVQPESDRTPGSGTICVFTGQCPAGEDANCSDVDGGRTSLYSPIYDLTGATHAEVKYWRWYTNNLGFHPNEDTWLVRVRNNGGAWVDLENTTQSANQWTFHSFDLGAIFGGSLGQVQVKFVASDTGGNSTVEAAVDDFEIQTSIPSAAPGESPQAGGFAFLGAWPNPNQGPSTIGFRVPVRTRVIIDLYDVGGRRVRTLGCGEFPAGAHTIVWNSRDAAGEMLSSGIYFVRMQATGFTASRAIVIAR